MKEISKQVAEATATETNESEKDLRARWHWVETSVWTISMLTALENGVKGGKWFSLIDKVHKPSNLQAA